MVKHNDFNDSKNGDFGSASISPTIVKDSFAKWLADGFAKKYPPTVYITCIDKVSKYLIQRKFSQVDLWHITNFEFFKNVYDKTINDKIFKATDKKTHAVFVQVGQAFLKFLKSKPSFREVPDIPVNLSIPSHPHMTIKEAIIIVLEKEGKGMTIEQIYNKIIEEGLYSFGAQNPQNVVRVEIDRACVNSNYTIRATKDCFRYERNQKGEKVYYLLPSVLNDNSERSYVIYGESRWPEQVGNEPPKIELWNDSIAQNFQIWMESMQYALSTKRNYCSAINRIVESFKISMDSVISESSTKSEAIHKFVSILDENIEFNAANSKAHNQLSAAMAAFVRFVDKEMIIGTETLPETPTVEESGLGNIVDYDEGKNGIREILRSHFQSLFGYSNINILWSATQNSLSMFLNDNAINSPDDLWRFIVSAFKGELVFSSPHIWDNPPDYPQNSRGLVINLARQNGGVVSREQIDEFFLKIKLTTLFNSFVLDKEQLLFYDNEKFILTEAVKPDTERCLLISKALDMLFSCENSQYIVLRDIASTWFCQLPELPNGLQWTPLLLQELIRIRSDIGYRVISSSLKGQALDTLAAAIVPSESEIQSFADVVHRFSFRQYRLPLKIAAEELRIHLREAGMLDGNELIYNMHKALKDYRFAFSDENRMVMILER